MSQKDRQEWQAMLGADPALQTAWNAFTAQLEKDAACIRDGVTPTGQSLAEAARAVHAEAGVND